MPEKSSENIQALIQQGVNLFQRGDLANAEVVINTALDVDPGNADASNLMGVIKLNSKCTDEAIKHFNDAISINGSFPDFRLNLALAYIETGNDKAAIDELETALALRPEYLAALNTLANIYMSDKQWELAVELLSQATSSSPESPDPWINLCGALQQSGRKDEAVIAGENGVRLQPDSALALYNLARAYGKQGQWEKAIDLYDQCIEVSPDYVDAYSNKAQTLINQGLYQQAEETARLALDLIPNNRKALNILALSLASQGLYDEAIQRYTESIQQDPDDAETRFNLSSTLLAVEAFSTGWDEFEYGLRPGCRGVLPLQGIPLWNGEPLNGKVIYVHGEQGIGEQIMYATMLEDLSGEGGRIIYACDKRLVPIFTRSMKHIKVVSLEASSAPDFDTGNLDYRVSLGSLGRFYRRSLDDFKPKGSFLTPDLGLRDRYSARYDSLGDGLKIGISWKTSSLHQSRVRNFPFTSWAPILTTPGCQFVSLQYGDVMEDCAAIKRDLGIDIFIDPEISPLESLEKSMAQIASVDLVISISNATVDLGASCGIKTWMMLGVAPHWHWFAQRNDSLWYDSVRAFRQKQLGDWSDVVALIASELQFLVNARSG